MVRIKFDAELMKIMNLFGTITRSKVKDVIKRDEIYIFIVQQGEIGKAIGKKAANVRKLENILKKKIRVIEYNEDLEKFIRNVVMPLNLAKVEIEDAVVTIHSPDTKTRGYLIGRSASHLRNTENIVKRYFPIDEIKVV